jgi:thymidylate synthase (FAD)
MRIKFIKPSYEIDMLGQTGIEKLKHIEKVARTCYKSEDKITEDSYINMINGLVKRNHTAMLEFADIHVKFIASRAFSHELVRHRIASFAQESQRYVGYDGAIEFIIPSWSSIDPCEFSTSGYGGIITNLPSFNLKADRIWAQSMLNSSLDYEELISLGWKNEQARDVLPNACKTEINIKTNLRSWMNIDVLRNHHTASPQMRELMAPLFQELQQLIPIVFDKE